MHISAEISVYPLRQDQLSPVIRELQDVLAAAGLQVTPAPMSTPVTGDGAAVFDALKDSFLRTAATGHVIMAATVSNARHAAADRLDAMHWRSILFPGLPQGFWLSIPFGDVISVRAVMGQKSQ